MRSAMAFIVLSLGVAAATSCGGSSSNSAANIDEFQAGAYRLFCDWQARCGLIGRSEQQSCYDGYTVIASGPIDSSGMVDAHRITFDAGAAGQCLEALSNAPCDQFFGLSSTPACASAARGTITPGVQCTVDLECTSGSCSPMLDGCTGTCVANAATGAACDKSPCNPSDVCDLQSHTCKTLGAAGAPCTGPFDCAGNLHCVTDGTGKSTCGTGGTAGAPCMSQQSCADGFYCDPTTTKCASSLGAGTPCTQVFQCQSGLVCVGLPQGGGGTGTCGAYLDAGSTCTPNALGCPLDMTCDAGTNKCTAHPGIGQPCGPGPGSRCDQNTYCDGTTMKCTPRVSYGAACVVPVNGGENPCGLGTCEVNTKKCLILCG